MSYIFKTKIDYFPGVILLTGSIGLLFAPNKIFTVPIGALSTVLLLNVLFRQAIFYENYFIVKSFIFLKSERFAYEEITEIRFSSPTYYTSATISIKFADNPKRKLFSVRFNKKLELFFFIIINLEIPLKSY